MRNTVVPGRTNGNEDVGYTRHYNHENMDETLCVRVCSSGNFFFTQVSDVSIKIYNSGVASDVDKLTQLCLVMAPDTSGKTIIFYNIVTPGWVLCTSVALALTML